MKGFKQLKTGLIRNYNGNNTFNPELMQAHSYKHWCYVREINGKVVFNNYSYSNTTAKHQSNMRQLLAELGITVDLYIEMPESLDSFEVGAIAHVRSLIRATEAEIARPRSQKAKNEERRAHIAKLERHIEELKALGAVEPES